MKTIFLHITSNLWSLEVFLGHESPSQSGCSVGFDCSRAQSMQDIRRKLTFRRKGIVLSVSMCFVGYLGLKFVIQIGKAKPKLMHT